MGDVRHFNTIAKEQVLAVLDKNGMLVPDGKYAAAVKNKIAAGQKLRDSIIANAIGRKLDKFCKTEVGKHGNFYHIEHLPKYAVFGHDMADCFCRLFRVSENTANEIAAAGALLNSYAALFDKICDDHIRMRPCLIRNCPSKIFSQSASLGIPRDGPIFNLKEDAGPPVKITILLINEYFKRCETLIGSGGSAEFRLEFQDTVSRLYEAELESINLTFRACDGRGKIHNILRNKSSLFIWLLALPCLSPSARKIGGATRIIKKAIMELGDAFWILDDIVDAVEDLKNGRWSYLTLPFARKVFLEWKDCALILDYMLNRGIILSAAEVLCAKYINAKRNLEKMTLNVVDFDKILLPWLRAWVESMAV